MCYLFSSWSETLIRAFRLLWKTSWALFWAIYICPSQADRRIRHHPRAINGISGILPNVLKNCLKGEWESDIRLLSLRRVSVWVTQAYPEQGGALITANILVSGRARQDFPLLQALDSGVPSWKRTFLSFTKFCSPERFQPDQLLKPNMIRHLNSFLMRRRGPPFICRILRHEYCSTFYPTIISMPTPTPCGQAYMEGLYTGFLVLLLLAAFLWWKAY